MITMIACTDINDGIGDAEGNLLFKIPLDLAHFKSITSGKIVVMGRKTWDSLPKRPLPKRKNYVVTTDKSFTVKGATKVINSIEEIVELGKHHDIYIIGGGEIYQQMMPYADRLIMTHVHTISNKAEVFFPKYDAKEWKMASALKNEASSKFPHSFTFATYERNRTQK